MKPILLVVAIAGAGMIGALLATACGGSEETVQVEVTLAEFSIRPAVGEIEAGEVTFVVTNDGKEPHEFVIIKSDLPAGELPVVEGEVPGDRVNLIDAIEPFAADSTERLTLNLSAGKYIFVCNIVEYPS